MHNNLLLMRFGVMLQLCTILPHLTQEIQVGTFRQLVSQQPFLSLIPGDLQFPVINQTFNLRLRLHPTYLTTWVLWITKAVRQDWCRTIKILVGHQLLEIQTWDGVDKSQEMQTRIGEFLPIRV